MSKTKHKPAASPTVAAAQKLAEFKPEPEVATAPVVQISNNSRCNELVAAFIDAAAKGQDALLDMAVAAFTAKREFEKGQPKTFAEFCKAIEHNPQSSAFRKLCVVGSKAARLEPHRAKLSPHFETTYNVARLDDDNFKKVVADPRFGRSMTAATLKEIVGKAPEPPDSPILKVYATEPSNWTKEKTQRLCALLAASEFKDAIRLETPPTKDERASKAMSGWATRVHKKLVTLVRKQINATKKARGKVWAKALNKAYKAELQVSELSDLDELQAVLHIIEQDDPNLLNQLQAEACQAVEMPDLSRYDAPDAMTPEQVLADFMQQRAEAKAMTKAKKVAVVDKHIT